MYFNRINPTDLDSIISYAIAYNKKHYIELNITTDIVDVVGYTSSNFSQVRTGINYCILIGSEKLFPIDNNQDISIFVFDQNEWKTLPGSPYPLRSDTPTSDTILVKNKPYINLGIYTPQLNSAEITLIHELMHAYGKMAINAGFDFDDCMDLMTVNGVPEPYYLNSEPDNVNSNFINQWERLYPWLNSLGVFPPNQ